MPAQTVAEKMANTLTMAYRDHTNGLILNVEVVCDELMRRPEGATQQELQVILSRLRDRACTLREMINA